MKTPSLLLCSIIAISAAGLPSRAALAQVADWRCDGPNCPDPDLLFNDIEDLTVESWPSSVTVDMPPISYACTRANDPDWDHPTSQGSIPWTLTISGGSLRSFLIGRQSASADLVGTFRTGGGVGMPTALDAEIGYVFAESSQDVIVLGGDSGVADLGNVTSVLTGGSFWNATASVTITGAGGVSTCVVDGQPVNGSGFRIPVSIPVSELPIFNSVTDLLRNQFRAAVAQAIQ